MHEEMTPSTSDDNEDGPRGTGRRRRRLRREGGLGLGHDRLDFCLQVFDGHFCLELGVLATDFFYSNRRGACFLGHARTAVRLRTAQVLGGRLLQHSSQRGCTGTPAPRKKCPKLAVKNIIKLASSKTLAITGRGGIAASQATGTC